MVEEIKLLIQAGYSINEAIRCATANGARLLDIDSKIGFIAKGSPANFIVTRGTTVQLPANLSNIEAIYINGRQYDNNFT